MKEEIIYLDLFSGTGGFAKALEKYFTIIKHYFSDNEKHAIANYKFNFKKANYVGPIESINRNELPRPNIITFGSPCQDFSISGKRNGLKGKRSSLIQHAIDIIAEKRPDIFIWENVKGAYSSNNREDFAAIIQAFANIGGYRLEWQLLNTIWLLPQNRERIFLIGHLAGSGRSFKPVFPITENERLLNESKEPGTIQLQPQYNSTTITTRVGKTADSTFISVPKIDQGGILDNSSIRSLTEIECERLQGFPDDWTKYGVYDGKIKEIAKTNRYKLIGNAVTVNIVELIAKKIS